MVFCKKCGMPDTRPGSKFVDGVCLACHNYDNRGKINFKERQKLLKEICIDRKKKKAEYDCIVAVSGGKDSTVIVHYLVDAYKMKPLLVTVCDEFTKTIAGTHNIKNIAERFNLDHLVFRCEPKTFKKETIKDFERELHPLKWIEEKIYSVPVKIAKRFNIPLVFFGENSGYEYGTTNILDMKHSLSDDETSVFYFFAFYPYDEFGNLNMAKKYGFRDLEDTKEWYRQGNIDRFTQIDSIAYIIQLWTKFPKFGFQRVSDMCSRFLRKGKITKLKAQQLIEEEDHKCDPAAKADFCATLGITENYFDKIVDIHANKKILYKDARGLWRKIENWSSQ